MNENEEKTYIVPENAGQDMVKMLLSLVSRDWDKNPLPNFEEMSEQERMDYIKKEAENVDVEKAISELKKQLSNFGFGTEVQNTLGNSGLLGLSLGMQNNVWKNKEN